MRRLVYSPKVYVYIQTPKETINISDLVVSGNVSRKLNQVSTAEVTFQNPYRQFTQPGNNTFSPMDKITIFLQRLPGMPIQVFTGYLDSVPYYQMYPGTCTVTASCSLKRLQYTYFDPGLPFMMHFMASYGWLLGPDGNIQSPGSNTAGTGTVGNVQVYGDSLAVGTDDGLKKATIKATTNAKVGITTAQGLKNLQANRSKLGDQLVISLGTNDFDTVNFKKSAESIMSLANGRPVYWLNIKRPALAGKPADTAINTALGQVAAKHSNLHIIDWKAVVDNGDVTLTDGMHPNAAGYKKRADMINDAVVGGVSANGSNSTTQSVAQPITADEIQAASMSDLAYACLKHIARWDPKHLFIEELPIGLVDRIQQIFNSLQAANTEATAEFNQWLKDFIGEGSKGTGSGSSSSGAAGSQDAKGEFSTAELVALAEEAGLEGEKAAIAGAIASAESQGNPKVVNSIGCVGLWQIYQSVHPELGMTVEDLKVPSKNAQAMMKISSNGTNWNPWTTYTGADTPGHEKTYLRYLETAKAAVGKGGSSDSDKDKASSTAEDSSDTNQTDPSTTTVTAKPNRRAGESTEDYQARLKAWEDSKTTDTPASSSDRKLYSVIKGGKTDISSPFGEANHGNPPHTHMGIDVPVPTGTECIAPCDGTIGKYASSGYAFGGYGGMVHFIFDEDVGEIKKGTVIGWGHVGEVMVSPGDKVKAGKVLAKSNHPAPHVHFIMRNDSNGMDGTVDPTAVFKALQKGETAPAGEAGQDAASGGGEASGGSVDPLVAAKTASVFSQLNFPEAVDAAESILLTGGKSLMNDQPLLPFIEQIIKGTMRSFQSLPDGDFLAFYPDYFGTMGTAPYWEIDDIEILEGNIQLTDEALATHVYVVGATLPNQSIEITRKLETTGVVNILNAGTSDFLNLTQSNPPKITQNPFVRSGVTHALTSAGQEEQKETELQTEYGEDTQPFLGTYQKSVEFLQRYGARPYVQEAPMIRSHVFETFYAYQQFMLMWARQFQTTFSFTFMPELYPGGLVAFPSHGIQMFIDEVHHSFDYTAGFTTQANLSAPSSMKKNAHPEISRGMVRGW